MSRAWPALLLLASVHGAKVEKVSECDACRMVIFNLNVSVLDELAVKGPVHAQCRDPLEAKTIRMDVAAMAEEGVERMCYFQSTRSEPKRRRACDNFFEDHAEGVSRWLQEWALDVDALDEWRSDDEAVRATGVTRRLCASALSVCDPDVDEW